MKNNNKNERKGKENTIIVFIFIIFMSLIVMNVHAQISYEETTQRLSDKYTISSIPAEHLNNNNQIKGRKYSKEWEVIEYQDFEGSFPSGLWDRFHIDGYADAEWDD